jgi:hypothetical protein
MHNAYRPGDEWDKPHDLEGTRAQLRLVEGIALAEPADAAVPLFDVLGMFQSPVQGDANVGAGNLEVVRPAHERRTGIKDKLRTRKAVMQREHQQLDLRVFKVHENTFSQKQEGAPALA